jgi:hypothetical protein
MSSFPAPWALCGGWAVDAWLGGQTRPHADNDLTVFEDDQRLLFEHLADWNLVAHDATLVGHSSAQWDGGALVLPAHIHARPPGPANRAAAKAWTTPPFVARQDGLDFDLQFNERRGDAMVLGHDPDIDRPLGLAIRSVRGLPVLAPEVILFFKATAYWERDEYPREHDLTDFVALAPLLARGDAEWLRDAMRAVDPEHPWLPAIAG